MAEENEKATAENKENSAPALGKFASVDALVRAYGELEAEFTRRSQRLRELEKRNKQSAPPQEEAQEDASVRAERESEELYRSAVENERVRSRIIGDYVSSLKGVPLMTGAGTGVAAPVKKPRSIAEAGDLALGYLKSKK